MTTPEEPADRTSRDGFASMGILLLTVAFILVIVFQIIF